MKKEAMIQWLLRHKYRNQKGTEVYLRKEPSGIYGFNGFRRSFFGDMMVSEKLLGGKWNEYRKEDVSKFFIGNEDQLCISDMRESPESAFNEVVEVIWRINRDIFHQISSEGFRPTFLLTKTACNMIVLEFCGIEIWNNVNDERDYIEEGERKRKIYEPLEPYLRRKIKEILDILKKIKM
jgi:hypothetical protein